MFGQEYVQLGDVAMPRHDESWYDLAMSLVTDIGKSCPPPGIWRFLFDEKWSKMVAQVLVLQTPPWAPLLLQNPGNSHTPDLMRSTAFVTSAEYVFIGVGSMASDHYLGDRGAFDVNSLASCDAPQIEVANGAELAPPHQSTVSLCVRGFGTYAGRDRVIKVLKVKFPPGFPSHQRFLSEGRLEHNNTINGMKRVLVDSMNAAIHLRDDNGKTYYSFSLDKSGCVTQLACVFGPALRGDDGGAGANAAHCCAAALARSSPVSSLTMHDRLMHASPRAIADTMAHTQGSALIDDPLKLKTPIDEAFLRGKGHRAAHDAGPQLQLPGNTLGHDDRRDQHGLPRPIPTGHARQQRLL